MNILPSIIQKKGLKHHWTYLNEKSQSIAIVARYDGDDKKKRFHQFMLNEKRDWVQGAATPLPLFGIHTLPRDHHEGYVYIFEGEKCTQAAHDLGLPAITSMMGSSQALYADWAILAGYRHIKQFILVPDNDVPGKKYMDAVYREVKKACPESEILVCELPLKNKGDDFIDWVKECSFCPSEWDGFSSVDEPYSDYLRVELEKFVESNLFQSKEYFSKRVTPLVLFDEDPIPLEETLSEVLPCPIQTLPESVANWLQGNANQMQISVDFTAVPFMVYTASLIGRKCALELRRGTGWIEYPNLWGMLIGRPSVMKTPAMEGAIKPLNKIALKALKNFQAKLKQYEADFGEWEIKTKVIKDLNKKSFKDALLSNDNIVTKFPEEEAPQKPIQKRYKTDDATIEKLGEILIENPQGLLLYRDELSGWLKSFEKTGRENDRQFFLESWSGKKDFNVDRIARGSLYIPSLFLSIFGSIQPGPLSEYVRSTIKGGIGDDGFLQRFQMMVWPDVKSDWQLVHDLTYQRLDAVIDQIYEFLEQMDFDPEGNSVILNFSDDAQTVFDEWQRKHELCLRKGILPSYLEAHFAKYKKLLPALCLVHEHLQAATLGYYPKEISRRSLTDSILWVEYLASHALRIYGSGSNAIIKAAKELLKRIQSEEITEPFSARDVYHSHHWSGLASADEVQEVVDFLVEKGFLAGSNVQTRGRPTQKYWVHPKIYEM
ncbi:MAG: DUF3987 domain-containing protein [Waddliaceae bacterium]